MRAFETRDIGLLRRALNADRVSAAYLLGDLDEPFFGQCRWWVAEDERAPVAVLMVFGGLATPALLTFGRPDGVAGAFREAALWLPEACYLKVAEADEPLVGARYRILDRRPSSVMALDRDAFRMPSRPGEVRRLTPDRVDEVLQVYRSYPGNFFEPSQLATGIYFGSFEDDRLVAVAGTHVFSPRERIGVPGNIVTVTDARGKGHARACTAAVVETLYDRGCDTIVLHVAESNAAAIAAYRALGFMTRGRIVQARGIGAEHRAQNTEYRIQNTGHINRCKK